MAQVKRKKQIQERGAQKALDQTALRALFANDHGRVYQQVIDQARARGLLFALGGGFAINAYTGLQRDTKDLDLYIRPAERAALIEILGDSGLQDYYDRLPYDRQWIYRGYAPNGPSGAIIVDVIWEMANHHAAVDDDWLTRGPQVEIAGQRLRLLPAEELIWTKIHVLQRDRCDWPDVFNLLYTRGASLDWERLLERLGDDVRLLAGVLSVFVWLSPARARAFPEWLWERVHLRAPAATEAAPEVDLYHVGLLDSRPWFIPTFTPTPV